MRGRASSAALVAFAFCNGTKPRPLPAGGNLARSERALFRGSSTGAEGPARAGRAGLRIIRQGVAFACKAADQLAALRRSRRRLVIAAILERRRDSLLARFVVHRRSDR